MLAPTGVEYFKEAIDSLKLGGMTFAPGLDELGLARVEDAIGLPLPPDLRLFLSLGVPKSSDKHRGIFPDWRDNPEAIMRGAHEVINDFFIFDIVKGGYWNSSFGKQPRSIEQAKDVALEFINSMPPLIPVYGHRFIPAHPNEAGNPIFSFHGPNDTIHYGYDLADYLSKEFGIFRPTWASKQPKTIPYWDELFFSEEV